MELRPLEPVNQESRPAACTFGAGEAEAYLRALIGISTEALIVISDDGAIVLASGHACACLGRNSESLVGHRLDDLVDLGADGLEGLLASPAHGRDTPLFLSVRQPSGAVRYLEVRCAPTNLFGRHLLMLRDVTDRAEIEAALRFSQERLATALAIGTMGAYAVDLSDETVWWSPEMYQLMQVDPDSFTPSKDNFKALVHPDDWDDLLRHRSHSIASGEPFSHEFRIIRPGGEVRWLSNRARASYDHVGRPVSHHGVALDVTDARRDAEALREQARMLHLADVRKNEFLAMLAHELRGPLAPIRNAAFVLEISTGADPALVKVGTMIDRHVRHLTRLVDDLLDMARVSTGKIRLRRSATDLVQVVNQALEMSQPLIDSKHHTLDVYLPQRRVMVDGDATRLAQVVCNLLDNAAKYTDLGGNIALTLAIEEKAEGTMMAVVRVKDDGRGIASDALISLFELFYQVDGNLDRSEGGLGIGLSLVRELVEMHGGDITATSRGLGMGSEFVVSLPLTGALHDEGLASLRAAVDVPATSGARVLIVDDNLDSAESLALLLELAGHEVHTAIDGESGIELALSLQPTLVLLDLGLPGADGYSVCAELRARGLTSARIVAVTGYGGAEARQRSDSVGFDDHLVKPIDIAALEPFLPPSLG